MKRLCFLEQFHIWHLPVILIGRLLHWEMAVFDTDLKLKKKRVARILLDRGWCKRIIAHHYPFEDSHTQALVAAGKIVDEMEVHPAIRTMVRMYGDDEVALVFKKVLAGKLAVLTSMQAYFRMNPASPTASIWLMPGSFCALIPVLKEHGIDYSFPDDVRILGNGFGGRFVAFIFGIIRWLVVFSGYSIHLLAQCFQTSSVIKNHLRFGISLSSPWFEKFKGGPREFTFLVDDQLISKREAGFLIEYPNSQSFYNEYRAKGFQLFPAIAPVSFRHIFESSILNARDELKYLPSLLLHSWRIAFVRDSVVHLLMARLTWGRVFAYVRFDHYVYCNKEGGGQIAANIFFRAQGIVSWNYSQFVGGPYQVDHANTPFDSRNVYWALLNSDYFLVNCEAQMRSMQKQHQAVRNYRVIGNVFSDMIAAVDSDVMRRKLLSSDGALINACDKPNIIAVFDTSYVDMNGIYSTFDEAAAFLNDFIRLAQSRSELLFLFKPSKGDDYFIDTDSIWSSPLKGMEVVRLRARFAALSNVFFLPDSADPVEVIAASDLVITNCFSSPTADALSAGIPAFWHDAESHVRGYPLDQVKGLVSHGYHDLVDQLGAAFSPEYLDSLYNQPNFRHLVNEHRDCHALDRLRRHLCGELAT